MADGNVGHERAGSKKVQKRVHNLNRLPSTQIPSRLRYGDDVNEDVTAPDRAGAAPTQYMNQSVFSMIAAAGSKTDFNNRFEDSSDSEAAEDVDQGKYHSRSSRKYAVDSKAHTQAADASLLGAAALGDRAKQLSGRETPRQTSKLANRPLRSSQASHHADLTQSPTSDSASESATSNPRDAPVMSRLLSAEAEFQAGAEPIGQSLARKSGDRAGSHPESTTATLLAVRLMEIFGFENPEKVIAEYPCWLLQSALLQGYLYLTQNHICFYAYLPKRSNIVTKTGYLSKRGRTNPKYRRYYFSLKGDVLTYYSDPSNVYFPQGNIDLRYGISASLNAETENQKDCKDFNVTTDHRTYHFRADSASSAKEWVKALQKTIFRSHNDGNSVKIALPVENVIDIEESPVVEFAETIKVRIIENDESYAVDEYFFSFFSHGKDALATLGSLIDDTATRRRSVDLPTARNDQTMVPEVEAGFPLSQGQSHASQVTKKASLTRNLVSDKAHPSAHTQNERVRTSTSLDGEGGRDDHENRSSVAPRQGSVDSHMQSSTERDTESSTVPLSPTVEATMSASQILTRSDVFRPRSVPKLATVQASSDGDNDRLSEHDALPPSAVREEGQAQLNHVSEPVLDRRTGALKIQTDSEISDPNLVRNTPSPTLHELAGRVGSYPFARAGALAKYLQNRSSRMSKVLAAESMSYVEKVTGMWHGGHKHYGENEGIVPDDKDVDPEDEEANVGHGDRFRLHFALPATEKLQATYFGYLHRVLPLYGKVYVSHRLFCFRSLLPGMRTKLILPLRDIENVDKEKGFRFGYHGLVLVIRGHEELFFEFNSADTRDDCTVTLLQRLESIKFLTESTLLDGEDDEAEESAKAEHQLLLEARRESVELPRSGVAASVQSHVESSTILFDDPKASILNFRPPPGMRITCLTIGSRGDVQPYIALCKGLLAEGHRPRIATHAEFGPWVKSHGIDFAAIGGDPAELMRICVENGMFTYSFLREASTKFRSWIDDLLASAWQACQGSDLLIESPSAMAGIHIAEALNIPYFRAFTMPWTRTRAYPHAFAVPEQKIGGAYNYFSYVMFDNVFWKGIAGQVNRWRQRELGLRGTNLNKMQPNKVPFLYNFSPHVVAPPLDYSDWVRVTGYWFLNESSTFQPPAELAAFIQKARDDGKKLVYIGFGSIVVSDPAALTKTVVESVLKADVRCILSKGWSDRLGDPSSARAEIPLPADIFQIKSAPHDWLFPQVDCAVHHGGAGTTGASLRAGIPTVIKPFFGDQFFFGGRVEDLGVGILLRKVNVSVFARALWEACHSERMRTKARRLGEQIRAENGVQTAIQALYRDFEYAKTLVRSRRTTSTPSDAASSAQNPLPGDPGRDGVAVLDYETEADLDNEESWAFVGNEDEVDEAARQRFTEGRSSLISPAPSDVV